MRVCNKCGENKPLTAEFFPPTRKPGRFRNTCRGCRSAHGNVRRKQRRASDPELVIRHRQETVAWRRNNVHRHRANAKRWFQENREAARKIARTATANYRARKRAVVGSFTGADVSNILKAQNHRCFYCFGDITEYPVAEHYIPLARGGSNWPSNLVGACADCNARKGVTPPEDFIRHRSI